MAINGTIATIDISPNASCMTLAFALPEASQTPIINGNKKLAVNGPEITPPLSKAIAVNIYGEKNVRASATAYPGIKI